MKTIFIVLVFNNLIFAALPPHIQNDKDMRVMKKFVQEHPKVSSTLRYISMETKSIYFAKECVIQFERKTSFHLPGWVGPASPLIYKSSNCPID